ncbi:MAG: hypothetical protein ACOCP8_01430 [archaeon]
MKKKVLNTFEMIQYLLKSKDIKETFIKLTNPNIHVFKCVDGQICYGIHGDGAIRIFKLNCTVEELSTEWSLIKDYKKYKNKKRKVIVLNRE